VPQHRQRAIAPRGCRVEDVPWLALDVAQAVWPAGAGGTQPRAGPGCGILYFAAVGGRG